MRVYPLTIDAISISAGASAPRTLFAIRMPTDQMGVILALNLGQQDQEASEELGIELRRISTASNGTFTAVSAANTPKNEIGDPAFTGLDTGGTAGYGVNYTVEPTTYDNKANWQDSFNVLQGISKVWVPEDRIWLPPAGRMGLRIRNSPGQALVLNGTISVGMVG